MAAICILTAWTYLGCNAKGDATAERSASASRPAATSRPIAEKLAVHVQTILGEDLPEPKDPWHTTGSVMVCPTDMKLFGDWLFIPCYDSGRICRFKRDPATAAIAYDGSQVMPFRAGRIGTRLFVRKLPSGEAMMYAAYYDPTRSLYWYAVDPRTGALTEKGKLRLGDAGFALLSPDQKHLYVISKKIKWLSFGRDGTPSVAGSLPAAGGGNSVMSPDGQHLYVGTRFSSAEANGQVVVYSRNPTTGAVTRNSVFKLTGNTVSKADSEPFLGISPDGRHVYVSLWRWDPGFLYVLNRDAGGALRLNSAGRPAESMKGCRNFTFSPDGAHGYYVAGREGAGACTGWFTRDPATGALAFAGKFRAGNGRYNCLVLDSANGNLFSLTWSHQNKGNSISAFRVPRTKPH